MEIPFHGEVVSSNASAGVTFDLYKAGETTAHTLLTTDYVVITDILILREGEGAAGIYVPTNVAGKRVFDSPSLAPSGGAAQRLMTPHVCPRGVVPVLIAETGNVSAIIHGVIASR